MSAGRSRVQRFAAVVRTVMGIEVCLLLGLWSLDAAYPFPSAALESAATSPTVTAADGSRMRVGLTAEGERRLPSLASVSAPLVHALLAAEDRRFYEHDGVDPRAVLRAVVANAGGAHQGASTITMQLARLLDPQPRTLVGKVKQAFRAWQLERLVPKEEILARYLDLVPFGSNLRGAPAAAHAFFGKRAEDLDAAESALLVSLLPAPSRYAPTGDPEAARTRRDRVLDRMRDEGTLDPADWAVARSRPLGLRPTSFPDVAPHAWLRVGNGPSSIDPALQASVECLARGAGGVDGLAIVVLDNATRSIVALAGAHVPSPRVLDATGRPRSAGSTLKPFLYARAFDLGIAVPETRLLDLPWRTADWAPGNFDRAWLGPVPAGEALALSRNLPAIRLAARLPRGDLAATLQRAGLLHIRPRHEAGVDLALGTDDVTPTELAGAYAALAGDGEWRRPWLAVAERSTSAPTRICSAGAAALVTHALADPRRPRPPGAAERGIAWKTGTSSRRRDAWAAGYTTRVTAVVWRGRLDGRPHPSLVGAEAAEPLLFAVLAAADPDPAAFGRPSDVERIEVCAESGYARTAACPTGLDAHRPAGARPLPPCTLHQHLLVERATQTLRCAHCRTNEAAGEVDERAFALYPPVLAAWRALAGLPVPTLPPHASDCDDPREPEALAPVIASPAANAVFRTSGRHATVPLQVLASTTLEGATLLVDGQTWPAGLDVHGSAHLPLEAGSHVLVVVDARGASATVRLTVERDR